MAAAMMPLTNDEDNNKHRVTIPCKWSFVVKSDAFHVLLLGFIGVFSLRKPKI